MNHKSGIRSEGVDMLLNSVRIRRSKFCEIRIFALILFSLEPYLPRAIYVEEMKARVERIVERLIVQRMAQAVHSDVAGGRNLREQTTIEFGLHSPGHDFPSNFLKLGLTFGILCQPIR